VLRRKDPRRNQGTHRRAGTSRTNTHPSYRINRVAAERDIRLKWGGIDFERGTMSVIRSVVYGVVGPCKTESIAKARANAPDSRGRSDAVEKTLYIHQAHGRKVSTILRAFLRSITYAAGSHRLSQRPSLGTLPMLQVSDVADTRVPNSEPRSFVWRSQWQAGVRPVRRLTSRR